MRGLVCIGMLLALAGTAAQAAGADAPKGGATRAEQAKPGTKSKAADKANKDKKAKSGKSRPRVPET